jgi:hypothetical protein
MLLVTIGKETFEIPESELMDFWSEIVMAMGADDAEMTVRFAE